MSTHKYIDRICWAALVLALAVTVLLANGEALGLQAASSAAGYEARLFDASRVHTIDIVMDDWEGFLEECENEEYQLCSLVIDGESCHNAAIRAKGNSSLTSVAAYGNNRYSFKVEFDRYDGAGTYYGLDKLNLNNIIQDNTYLKDFLSYRLMDAFGVASPLCSYVYVSVNGEEWGLYLAVEGVEEAFLERNYGSDYGELYKPDSMSFGGGRGNGKDFDMGNFDFGENQPDSHKPGEAGENSGPNENSGRPEPPSGENGMPNIPAFGNGEAPDGGDFPDTSNTPNTSDFPDAPKDFAPPEMFGGEGEKGGFGGGFGMGSSDVKLQYIDDELDSYSNIWDNAKTDITEADQKRLIASLKKLSNNEDIASVVDIEQVIRYFVVHNYVCNDDSYTGAMVHNYYLYEKDGRLAMLPWDYNLAFGTFGGGDAAGTVNTPVDAPVSGDLADRPMINWIFESEEYTELYHQYFGEFLNSVDIQGMIEDAYQLIKSYVEKDPTAFYTYEEFETGVETLRQFCSLRSESISMQLESGETTTDMGYADASGITLSDMGHGQGRRYAGRRSGRLRRTEGGEGYAGKL